MGYEVALTVFLASTFDLVLTDLEMPVMDGLSLAGHIKARSPSTPVILLTGVDRETVLKKVEKGPVDSVIFKPIYTGRSSKYRPGRVGVQRAGTWKRKDEVFVSKKQRLK